jgi:hypothetical protein
MINAPKRPDIREANKIENFEILINSSFRKANSDIKIDIVNPIPAKNPAPIMCCIHIVSGSFIIFNFRKMYTKKNIPKTFPKTNPVKIPRGRLLLKNELISMSSKRILY